MTFLASLTRTLSVPQPWIAGIVAQGVIKTLTPGPPDINRALETSTFIQGGLLTLIYEVSKETVGMWKL